LGDAGKNKIKKSQETLFNVENHCEAKYFWKETMIKYKIKHLFEII